MLKRIFVISCFLIILTINAFAQQNYLQNPLAKVHFLNGRPTDTITLIASYSQISNKLSIGNKAIIETIKRNTGKQVKGLDYSVYLKLENYPIISVPCSDINMLNALMTNTGKKDQVVVKCVVYRFYYFDGICNFFYIDKINLLNKADLITRNK